MSVRAEILYKRTYSRELIDSVDGGSFETWDDTVLRILTHQQWLWERALDRKLNVNEQQELVELGTYFKRRLALPAGRTLWLGGTEISKRRESSQFNCSYINIETPQDLKELFWLLLQGCGVGFTCKPGNLTGFPTHIRNIKVIPSERKINDGLEGTDNLITDSTWTIRVGDSAEGWTQAIYYLLSSKLRMVDTLVIDCSQVRPAGKRLKGYGWLCNGDKVFSQCLVLIANILNNREDQLLTFEDIHSVCNILGECLSTRRSSQISLHEYNTPGWEEFARIKIGSLEAGKHWLGQSNNSLVYKVRPTKVELSYVFSIMQESGGNEPGLVNYVAALTRAPWYNGLNPCGEILLPNRGFCNLVEFALPKFKNNFTQGLRVMYLLARANYRQTLVDLHDGILSDAWHQNNEFLHLCGVSITGIVQWEGISSYYIKQLKRAAYCGAINMAVELGTTPPKNITCGKPSGTVSKIMDVTEGIHRPLGKYIVNNILFSSDDEVIPFLRSSGYIVREHPYRPKDVIVSFPIKWDNVEFNGPNHTNDESAVSQLKRYLFWMNNWCDQNMSCTIYYTPEEIPQIIDFLYDNWDNGIVALSFALKLNPLDGPEKYNAYYLPQEVVTEEKYNEMMKHINPIDINSIGQSDMTYIPDECEGGACPTR